MSVLCIIWIECIVVLPSSSSITLLVLVQARSNHSDKRGPQTASTKYEMDEAAGTADADPALVDEPDAPAGKGANVKVGGEDAEIEFRRCCRRFYSGAVDGHRSCVTVVEAVDRLSEGGGDTRPSWASRPLRRSRLLGRPAFRRRRRTPSPPLACGCYDWQGSWRSGPRKGGRRTRPAWRSAGRHCGLCWRKCQRAKEIAADHLPPPVRGQEGRGGP